MPKPKENVIICDNIPTEFKRSNDRFFTEYSPGTALVDENISKYLLHPTYSIACFIPCFSSPLLELAIALEQTFVFYALYL